MKDGGLGDNPMKTSHAWKGKMTIVAPPSHGRFLFLGCLVCSLSEPKDSPTE